MKRFIPIILVMAFSFAACTNEMITRAPEDNPGSAPAINGSWVASNSDDSSRTWILEFAGTNLKITAGCSGGDYFEGPYQVDTSVRPAKLSMKIINGTHTTDIGRQIGGVYEMLQDNITVALSYPGEDEFPGTLTPGQGYRVFTGNVPSKQAYIPLPPNLIYPGYPITTPIPYRTYSGINPLFSWQEVDNATSYSIQVAEDPTFDTIIYSDCGIVKTSIRYKIPLRYYCMYYWRVSASNSEGVSMWSPVYHFMTKPDL